MLQAGIKWKTLFGAIKSQKRVEINWNANDPHLECGKNIFLSQYDEDTAHMA